MGRTTIRAEQVDENTLEDDDSDTKVQVEKSADEDKIRFDTGGTERMIILSDGAVGIGTTTPDNLLTVVGGHISSDGGVKSGEVHFTWSKHSAMFAHGTADLVSYLSFGDNIVWGWIEVTLTDDHFHARATGKYTKRYQIGRNAGGAVIHQSFEVPACLGAIVDEFKLGDFEVEDGTNDLRIPIYNISEKGNKVCVFVEGQIFISNVIDGVDLILNSLSLSTPSAVSNSETRDYYSIMSDRVGISTSAAGRKLDVLDASNPQIRLTHTDSSKYVDMQATTAGDFEITGVSSVTDHTHLKYIAAGHATMIIQSNASDGDAQLGFSVDAGSSLVFALGVDDGDDDKFKIGHGTIDSNTRMTITTAGYVGVGTTSPHSTFHAGASQAGAYESFTSTTKTLDSSHFIVDYVATTNTDTEVSLPSPSNIAGRMYHILNNCTAGADVKVSTPSGAFLGSQLESASTTDQTLVGDDTSRQMQSISVISTGSDWFIIHDERRFFSSGPP